MVTGHLALFMFTVNMYYLRKRRKVFFSFFGNFYTTFDIYCKFLMALSNIIGYMKQDVTFPTQEPERIASVLHNLHSVLFYSTRSFKCLRMHYKLKDLCFEGQHKEAYVITISARAVENREYYYHMQPDIIGYATQTQSNT